MQTSGILVDGPETTISKKRWELWEDEQAVYCCLYPYPSWAPRKWEWSANITFTSKWRLKYWKEEDILIKTVYKSV